MGPLEARATALSAFDAISADQLWTVEHVTSPRAFKSKTRALFAAELDLILGLEHVPEQMLPVKFPRRANDGDGL